MVILSNRRRRFSLIIIAGAIFSTHAFAFPEMVRHNYVNCISCHVSPSGGGVLTQYGRELSREIMSMRGTEKETPFLFGAVKTAENVNLGGDVRTLILYRDSPNITEGKVILMQSDLEGAYTKDKVTFVATAGYKETIAQPKQDSHFISRRHYVNYRPVDTLSFRAGKFMQAFGINTAEHAISTKRGLGWNEGSETYNAEMAYLGEQINAYLTAIAGRPDVKELKAETGISSSVSTAIASTHKAGVSYYYGKKDLSSRHVAGPFAILGFTPNFFLLSEVDYQKSFSLPSNTEQNGLYSFNKIDYEFTQGLHGFLIGDFSHTDLRRPESLSKGFGVGTQIFPSPHFDVNLTYQYIIQSGASSYTDLLYMMLHYYL